MTRSFPSHNIENDIENDAEKIENWRKKLKFRAWHRGTREMDLIMGRFADDHLPQFSVEQLTEFEHMLTNNDPDLYNWITKREPVPDGENSSVMILLLKRYQSE
jgi:antitoxin CptB